MTETTITQRLADAIRALVEASDAAERVPGDRQAARRAIEKAALVVQLARLEGFGGRTEDH